MQSTDKLIITPASSCQVVKPKNSKLFRNKSLKNQDLDRRIQEAVDKHGTTGKRIWSLNGKEVGLSAHRFRLKWKKLLIEQKKQTLWTSEVLEKMTTLIQKSESPNLLEICDQLDQEFGGSRNLHEAEKYFNKIIKELKPKPKKLKKCVRWSSSENEQLTSLFEKYGRNWDLIAQEMNSDRTAKACNDHWINYLNPLIRNDSWTETEDQQLKDLVEKYHVGNWSLIAKEIKSRSARQCALRWKYDLNFKESASEIEVTNPSIPQKVKRIRTNLLEQEEPQPKRLKKS